MNGGGRQRPGKASQYERIEKPAANTISLLASWRLAIISHLCHGKNLPLALMSRAQRPYYIMKMAREKARNKHLAADSSS